MKTRKLFIILLIGIVLAGLSIFAFRIIQHQRNAQSDFARKIFQERFFEQIPILSEEEKKNPKIDFLEIYGPEETGEKVKVSGYVAVPGDASLQDKLELLIGLLSEKQFDNKPMRLAKIEEKDGRKIATIDIIDQKSPEDENSWYQSFQGSTGGSVTQQKLVKTLLQKNYKGEWIGGLEFTYNGKPFDVWDHINLSGTQLR
jgi:hypothetical protein